jgi:hypothetical protein
MNYRVIASTLAAVTALGSGALSAHAAPFLIVGDDQKAAFVAVRR